MSFDLTPPEHEHSEAVIQAAYWLANEQDPPRPIILYLRQRFGLSALEGCEAVALAARFQRAHV